MENEIDASMFYEDLLYIPPETHEDRCSRSLRYAASCSAAVRRYRLKPCSMDLFWKLNPKAK